jgi:hypothetical protein
VAAALPAPLRLDDTTYAAPACFAESLRIYAEVGMEAEQARTLSAWAAFAAAQGDSAQAAALTAQARAIFARLGLAAELAHLDAPDSAVA